MTQQVAHTPKLKKMSNVDVYISKHGGQYALSCDYNGAHYHVWLRPDTHELSRDSRFDCPTLYKNPLTDDRNSPEYFNTRLLRADSTTSSLLIQEMLRFANENALFKRADERAESERQADRQQLEAAERLDRIRAAAPDLLEALKQIRNVAIGFHTLADVETHGTSNMATLWKKIQEAEAAISKAETCPECDYELDLEDRAAQEDAENDAMRRWQR